MAIRFIVFSSRLRFISVYFERVVFLCSVRPYRTKMTIIISPFKVYIQSSISASHILIVFKFASPPPPNSINIVTINFFASATDGKWSVSIDHLQNILKYLSYARYEKIKKWYHYLLSFSRY